MLPDPCEQSAGQSESMSAESTELCSPVIGNHGPLSQSISSQKDDSPRRTEKCKNRVKLGPCAINIVPAAEKAWLCVDCLTVKCERGEERAWQRQPI
jgi:hypothetical protein